jgi:hypothetical protein
MHILPLSWTAALSWGASNARATRKKYGAQPSTNTMQACACNTQVARQNVLEVGKRGKEGGRGRGDLMATTSVAPPPVSVNFDVPSHKAPLTVLESFLAMPLIIFSLASRLFPSCPYQTSTDSPNAQPHQFRSVPPSNHLPSQQTIPREFSAKGPQTHTHQPPPSPFS